MISTRFRGVLIALAFFLLLLLSVIAGLRIYGNWALNKSLDRYQKEAGPFDVREYEPEEVQHPLNIAVWLKAGSSILHLTKEQRVDSLTRLLDVDYKEWNSNDRLLINEMLIQNTLAIQVLERTNRMTRSTFDLSYGEGYEIRLPPYLEFLQARKLLAGKARLHLAEQQLLDAAKTAKMLERMAAGLNHETLLISDLVGQVAEKDYYELVHEMLALSDQTMLREFLSDIQHLDKMSAPVSRVIEAEGASLYITLRSTKRAGVFNEENGTKTVRILYPFMKGQLIAAALDLHRRYSLLSAKPFRTVPQKEWSVHDNYIQSEIQKAFFPDVGSIVERFQSTESARILARTAIQLCLFAKENGKYPGDLSRFGSIVSPYTGEKATYRIQPDGSATLAFTEADAYWESRKEKLKPAKKPRFIWTLPQARVSSAQ